MQRMEEAAPKDISPPSSLPPHSVLGAKDNAAGVHIQRKKFDQNLLAVSVNNN